jgi:hypothetical protein
MNDIKAGIRSGRDRSARPRGAVLSRRVRVLRRAPSDPNHISPADMLATVGLNSRIDTAVKVRAVHRGMGAACAPILAGIPADAELLSFEPLDEVDALWLLP